VKRVGIILPSVNTVLEDDLRRFLPRTIGAHVARVRLLTTAREDLLRVVEETPKAAALLGDAGVDAIAFACTGGSLIGGAGSSETIVRRITEATDTPATTTTLALFAAFQALGIRTLALCSPFDDSFNDAEAAFLTDAGFPVVSKAGLGINDPRLCADVTQDQIADLAATACIAQADAIFLSCANVRGFDAVEMLERRFSKPVVTSNQVVLWALLGLASVPTRITGGGRLFNVSYKGSI
jgi:maleate isomerase